MGRLAGSPGVELAIWGGDMAVSGAPGPAAEIPTLV